MCTYQGQLYLRDQLESIYSQRYKNWVLHVSDDGSKDKTLDILNSYQQKWPEDRLVIHVGPSKGFVANFLSLTCKDSVNADYYAYSDQDDVWDPTKLDRAVKWLESVPREIPALYCSRTRLVDAKSNYIGLSPLFTKPPSFANALVQNIAGGNTMVFNHAACELLREVGENHPIAVHDWWVYMVVTGCGGKVFYDSEPTLCYRQHGNNLIGMNVSFSNRLTRIRMLWQGFFRNWNECNVKALRIINSRLTHENRGILEHFAKVREMSLIPRLVNLNRSGVYRQTHLGNLGLILAAVFKKI